MTTLQIMAVVVPAIALIVGAIAAVIRRPPVWLPSLAQHTAAGVVLASVAVELIPELRIRAPELTVIGFFAGIGLMFAIRTVVRRLEKRDKVAVQAGEPMSEGAHGGKLPVGMLIAIGIDLLVDGLTVGAAFAVGEAAGLTLALALTIEMVFLGVSAVLTMTGDGVPRSRAVGFAIGFAALFLASAIVGVFLLAAAPDPVLGLALGIGAVALMYLVTEELLIEAHETPETEASVGAFFLGFLVVLFLAEINH